jgi:hypothetical protein
VIWVALSSPRKPLRACWQCVEANFADLLLHQTYLVTQRHLDRSRHQGGSSQGGPGCVFWLSATVSGLRGGPQGPSQDQPSTAPIEVKAHTVRRLGKAMRRREAGEALIGRSYNVGDSTISRL